jgi:hypothetical protein
VFSPAWPSARCPDCALSVCFRSGGCPFGPSPVPFRPLPGAAAPPRPAAAAPPPRPSPAPAVAGASPCAPWASFASGVLLGLWLLGAACLLWALSPFLLGCLLLFVVSSFFVAPPPA